MCYMGSIHQPGFVLQEELYSYVTVSDDQTFKGKTNITIESA
jgi:hypothetical protein